MRAWWSVAWAILASTSAAADEPATVPAALRPYGARARVVLGEGLGGGTALRIDGDAKLRLGAFTTGLGTSLPGSRDGTSGADLMWLVGGGFDVSSRIRVEALAEIGYRFATVAHGELASADYERPLLGLQLGGEWRWFGGDRVVNGFVGLDAYVRAEAGPSQQTELRWTECNVVIFLCEKRSAVVSFGDRIDAGLMMRVGIDFGL